MNQLFTAVVFAATFAQSGQPGPGPAVGPRPPTSSRRFRTGEPGACRRCSARTGPCWSSTAPPTGDRTAGRSSWSCRDAQQISRGPAARSSRSATTRRRSFASSRPRTGSRSPALRSGFGDHPALRAAQHERRAGRSSVWRAVSRHVRAGRERPNLARHFEENYRERNTAASIVARVGGATAPASGATKVSTPHLSLVSYPSAEAIAPGSRFLLILEVTPARQCTSTRPRSRAIARLRLRWFPGMTSSSIR